MMLHDMPPWYVVYQQTQRWIEAKVFEALAHDGGAKGASIHPILVKPWLRVGKAVYGRDRVIDISSTLSILITGKINKGLTSTAV